VRPPTDGMANRPLVRTQAFGGATYVSRTDPRPRDHRNVTDYGLEWSVVVHELERSAMTDWMLLVGVAILSVIMLMVVQ
jgi:hypothetical protein